MLCIHYYFLSTWTRTCFSLMICKRNLSFFLFFSYGMGILTFPINRLIPIKKWKGFSIDGRTKKILSQKGAINRMDSMKNLPPWLIMSLNCYISSYSYLIYLKIEMKKWDFSFLFCGILCTKNFAWVIKIYLYNLK